MKLRSGVPMKKNIDLGLLIIRVVLGGTMAAFHGWPKLIGGPERWAKVGGAMSHFGLDFFPAFWGFLATTGEFFGALLVILGIFFRPALVLLMGTMFVAAFMHLMQGDGLSGASHAIEFLAVFTALLFTGPGKHTVQNLISK